MSTKQDEFAMPPPPTVRPEVRSAAVAAAAAAAASAAPGQRERAIERAAAAAIAAASTAKPPTKEGQTSGREPESCNAPSSSNSSTSLAAQATYTPPDWSGAPTGVEYVIEILKNGSIVETRPVAEKAYYILGRTPACDFVMEHPSTSRLHAVIQYKGDTNEAFIWDNHSTHGTFINKKKIQPGTYVPLRVGDTIKIGCSSRLLILGGPSDLLPPEGLTKSAKLQLAQLQYAAKQAEKDKQAACQVMAAAISGDVTWGMGGPDAVHDEDEIEGDVDWRALDSAGKLTEKQQKTADKVKQREYKIKNLEAEVERIMSKEKQEGGLTQGQATTLARNEQAIDRLKAELEDLEEALMDSIKDSITGKKKAAEKSSTGKRRRGTSASDEEYLDASDSDDDFYDRTQAGGLSKKKVKSGSAAAAAAGKAAPQQVESAQSLYGKREVLKQERDELLKQIQEEEQRAQEEANSNKTSTDMEVDGQQDKAGGASEAAVSVSGASNGSGPGQADDGEAPDSLDAFMSQVEKKMEGDKLSGLRSRLSQVESQLSRCEKLLRIADPEGWLAPGSKAAQAAVAQAQQQRQQQEAAERQPQLQKEKEEQERLAQQRLLQQQEHAFQEEVESEDERDGSTNDGSAQNQSQQQQAKVPQKAARPTVLKPNQGLLIKAAQPRQTGSKHQQQEVGVVAGGFAKDRPANSAAAEAAAKLISEFSGQKTQHELAGEHAKQGVSRGPIVSKAVQRAAEVKASKAVAEDLGALSAAERMRQELKQLEEEERREAEAAAKLAEKRAQQEKQQALQQKLGY